MQNKNDEKIFISYITSPVIIQNTYILKILVFDLILTLNIIINYIYTSM